MPWFCSSRHNLLTFTYLTGNRHMQLLEILRLNLIDSLVGQCGRNVKRPQGPVILHRLRPMTVARYEPLEPVC
jgi:hypothetical protein